MLDYGHFTSGNGQKYDITGYIIILTSNALADTLFSGKSLGFGKGEEVLTAGRIRRELENAKIFRPEFINRLDAVIAFRAIGDDTARQIAKNQLADLIREVKDKAGVSIKYDEKYLDELMSKRDPKYGGRDVYRLVQQARRYAVKLMIDDPGKDEYTLSIPKDAKTKDKFLNDW
jgi:ATP-dependent Clp protease ATP-binding subunit ClpC